MGGYDNETGGKFVVSQLYRGDATINIGSLYRFLEHIKHEGGNRLYDRKQTHADTRDVEPLYGSDK